MPGFIIRNRTTGEHNIPTYIVLAALVAACFLVAMIGG